MRSLKSILRFVLLIGVVTFFISCSDKGAEPEEAKRYKIAFTISPDGDGSNIYTINPDGTSLAQLSNVTSIRSCDHPMWSPDGQYIYYKDFLDENNDIFRMDVDGGNKINLTNSTALDRPCDISPDGSKMLIISGEFQGTFDLFILDLSSFALTNLTNGQFSLADAARYTPDGQKILFPALNGQVYDIHVVNLDGSPDIILYNCGTHLRRFEISPNGQKLVYESRGLSADSTDVWTCDIDGANRVKVSQSGFENLLASWSPDSRKIAYCEYNGVDVSDIISINSDGTGRTNLSGSADVEHTPKWSPDGTKIAYIKGQRTATNLYIMNTNGTGKTALTNNITSGLVHEISWSPAL